MSFFEWNDDMSEELRGEEVVDYLMMDLSHLVSAVHRIQWYVRPNPLLYWSSQS